MSIERSNRMQGVKMSPIRLLVAKCAKMRMEGIAVKNYTIGQPDFPTPKYVVDACKQALDEGLTGYVDHNGIIPLREAICAKLKRDNGLSYQPSEITVTNGVAQATYLGMMAFLNPGDEVLVPDPVYFIYNTIPGICGAVVKNYSLREENQYQLDIEELKGLITEKTKMICIVSPSNPTGAITRKETLEKLADLIRDTDIIVMCDEIYEKLTYEEDIKHVSFASLPGMRERTLVLNGLSKAFAMTGWRMGYIAAPANLIEPLSILNMYSSAGTSGFIQKAASVALAKELEAGAVEEMRLEFKRRRDYLLEEIGKMNLFSCHRPEGAFYIFLNIKKTGMTSQEFSDYMLNNYHAAMVPGDAFGPHGEGYVRLSYATSMEALQECIEILNKVDRELSK